KKQFAGPFSRSTNVKDPPTIQPRGCGTTAFSTRRTRVTRWVSVFQWHSMRQFPNRDSECSECSQATLNVMPYQHLLTKREGAVEYLTLNRPEVRNAFNEDMIAELTDWSLGLADRAAPEDVRVAVLSGAGKVFCAGADIGWMAKTVGYSQ